jgi:hypothetical protein
VNKLFENCGYNSLSQWYCRITHIFKSFNKCILIDHEIEKRNKFFNASEVSVLQFLSERMLAYTIVYWRAKCFKLKSVLKIVNT